MSAQQKYHIKSGDIVQVIRGDSRGQKGKVLQVQTGKARAVVEGVNLVKRHQRKTQDRPEGGIVEKEAPLPVSVLRRVEASTGRPERKAKAEKAS